ncbi:hypothetical protein [Pararobbsia alpina]|uniref:Porin domain-containing protein n=1 Tax=Pararobbsia alpina TaxID=621374 RepID=A0A6S7BDP6_9BURK|nr:hypothetical protein [Pararobbsia alpina]CAB3787659.1 hypothetical protein LMG28138_02466 [Pararobbsia alpina]
MISTSFGQTFGSVAAISLPTRDSLRPSAVSNPSWHQITLMLDYDVTKRTSLYMQAEGQHVVSAHTGTEFDYADSLAAADMSSGENQVVYRVGITHRF